MIAEERLRRCDGWVTSMRGHTVAFTGQVLVDGIWVPQAECAELAARKGAAWRDDWTSTVSCSSTVTWQASKWSTRNAVKAASSSLLSCLASWGRTCMWWTPTGSATCWLARWPAAGGCGATPGRSSSRHAKAIGFWERRSSRVARHAGRARARCVDWDQVDAATAAHEQTIRALIAHLGRQRIDVLGPWRGAPRFDAGWSRGRRVYVAEVKSLRGAREEQQVRLGLGQLLDYLYCISARAGRIVPVLVLERQPADDHWGALCAAHGVHLTWAPDFPGI